MSAVPITDPNPSAREAITAVAEAFAVVFGRKPTRTELVLLAAQSAHETRSWDAMPCFNPAGLKELAPSAGRSYFVANTTEWLPGPDGKRVPRVLPQTFKAFRSLGAGMAAWLDLLKRGYPLALQGASVGDAGLFVLGLLEGWGRSLDYFTGPRDIYQRNTEWHALKLATTPGVDWAALCEPETYGDGLWSRFVEVGLGGDDE